MDYKKVFQVIEIVGDTKKAEQICAIFDEPKINYTPVTPTTPWINKPYVG